MEEDRYMFELGCVIFRRHCQKRVKNLVFVFVAYKGTLFAFVVNKKEKRGIRFILTIDLTIEKCIKKFFTIS